MGEMGVRDDDPVQEMISGANMFYAAGTHRSPQCKDGLRTPGPGAYRTPSTFPLSARDEVSSRASGKRRSPAFQIKGRSKSRIVDIGNPFAIVPPVQGMFRSQVEGKTSLDMFAKGGTTVNTMPPCNSDGRIAKGHGGDVPKGFGPPY